MRYLLILILLVAIGCGNNSTGKVRQPPADPQQDLVDHNRQAMRSEQRDIDNYIDRHRFNTTETPTGVHIAMIHDEEGPTARPDQLVEVNYDLLLLNGRKCYSSAEKGAENFRVEHDQVESGLHEAIQLMSAGDSAIIIIPSYRAHGLIGDQAEIPMRSTIVYHLGLQGIRNGR